MKRLACVFSIVALSACHSSCGDDSSSTTTTSNSQAEGGSVVPVGPRGNFARMRPAMRPGIPQNVGTQNAQPANAPMNAPTNDN